MSEIAATLLKSVIVDLAHDLGIDPGEVTVTDVTPTVWPDASLGCPEPGMFYSQVLIDGFRVLLTARGQLYDYRIGGTAFRRCEQPGAGGTSYGGYPEHQP